MTQSLLFILMILSEQKILFRVTLFPALQKGIKNIEVSKIVRKYFCPKLKWTFKNVPFGIGELAQWLTVLFAFPEDPSFSPTQLPVTPPGGSDRHPYICTYTQTYTLKTHKIYHWGPGSDAQFIKCLMGMHQVVQVNPWHWINRVW